MLFPATYELKKRQDVKDLVAKQLAAFKLNLGSVSLARAHKKNLTATTC